MNRQKYFEIKQQVEKRENYQFEFENGTGKHEGDRTYDMYLKAKAMTYEEQVKWRADWEQYYQDVENGYYGLMRKLCADAMAEEDEDMVKSLTAQMNAHFDKHGYRPTPAFIDPASMDSVMISYLSYRKETTRLREIVDDNQHVYEKKAKKDDTKAWWSA